MGKIIDQFETLEEIKKEYPPTIIDKKLKYQPGDIFYATDYSTSLTLLYPTSNKKGGKTTWVAQCSCGKYTVVRNEQLTFKGKNSKRSCGCLKERLGFTTKADWQKGTQPPKKQEEVLKFEIETGISEVNMKINILSIDFIACRDAVVNDPECKYIIMNEETLKMLQQNGYAKPLFKNKNKDVPFFYGVPIATCNDLTVGQIELVR